MGREFLGGFEFLVLLALIRLGDDAYGVPISEAIEEVAAEMSPSEVSTSHWNDSSEKDSCRPDSENPPPNAGDVRRRISR